jgi:hypothetical protein
VTDNVITVKAMGPPGPIGPAGATGAQGPQGTPGGFAIDFVADCGADPTGVADCGPALTVAYPLLSGLGAQPYSLSRNAILVIPPGRYLFNNPSTISTTWDFLNKASSVRIQGQGAGSVFMMSGLGGASLLQITNLQACVIDGLTFIGLGVDAATRDVGNLFAINAQSTVVSNCGFYNLIVYYYLVNTFGPTCFRDILCGNCASTDPAWGLFHGYQAPHLEFDNVNIHDNLTLNGIPNAFQRTDLHQNSIRVAGPSLSVLFRNCLVDEDCRRNIWLDGSGGRISVVDAKGLTLNPATLSGNIASIHAHSVNSLHVDGIYATTDGGVPMAKLEDVGRAELRQLRPSGTSVATYHVTADSACKNLLVQDPDGFNATKISANAAIPYKFLDVYGVVTTL